MPVLNQQSGRSGFLPILITATVTFLLTILAGASILFATHALAFTPSDLLSGIGQIKRSTWDNLTRGFALWVLPQGHGWGLDADTVDSFHAASFALQRDFLSFSSLTLGQLSSLNQEISSLDTSLATGELASFFQNASNLVSGTLSDSRLSSNVALLNNSQTFTGPKTFSSGTLTVAAGTTLSLSKGSLLDVQGSLSLPPGSITTVDLADSSVTSLKILDGTIVNADISSSASIAYSKLNLAGSIVGSDLSPSIAITTSGAISAGGGVSSSSSLTTTGSGTLSIAGASTLSSSLSVLGASTLAGTTVGNLTSTSGNITSTLPDSSSAIAFNFATQTTYATLGAKLLSIKNNATELLSLNKDGLLTINGNLVSTGTLQGTQLISTIATGTPPLSVSSTTQVTNLNVSFLEGNNSATLLSQPQPNLIPNSDFGRRNKWMTFMPETFTDTSGWTQWLGTNGVGSVASNILTAPAGDASWAARAGLTTWRDVRASAQFKAISTTAVFRIEKFVDSNNQVAAGIDGAGNFVLVKTVAGTPTTVGTVAQALTLNNWYWLELEAQGTTYIAKLYSSGVSAVAKSSATLLQTLSGTISDSAFTSGGYVSIHSNVASSQWGGLATGYGGVYVEGWGPESWYGNSTVGSFGGTLGGQAIGFDETADSGPLGKQWTLRTYIPNASRWISLVLDTPQGSIANSTAYTYSFYEKVSGLGGSGALVNGIVYWNNSAGTFPASFTPPTDSGETSWTRKTITNTSHATATAARIYLLINTATNNTAGSATGTAFFMLPQLEYGSVATPWRNASADNDSLRSSITLLNNFSTTSATGVPIDARDFAMDLFLPWDATVDVEAYLGSLSDTLAATVRFVIYIDGTGWPIAGSYNTQLDVTANTGYLTIVKGRAGLAAGKHRIYIEARASAGTLSILGSAAYQNTQLLITATRGR